jgi:hypothetical protein
MTKRAILYVETTPADGREGDYNAWYDEVHIPEIFKYVPGVKAATRFKRAAEPAAGEHPYCTVYEIEADDPGQTLSALGEAARAGQLNMSDASAGVPRLTLWVEHAPRVTSA